jgi:hypothetical protein
MRAAAYEEVQSHGESAGVFWRLLRLDAVRRSLRWSVPFAVVVGLLIRIGAQDVIRDWGNLPFHVHHPKLIPMFTQLWLGVLFAVIIAHFNSRCSGLGLGLPISSRTLWLARVVSIAAAGVIPIAIVIVTTTEPDPAGRFGVISPLSAIGARTAAGFILAVVLFQLPSPGVHRIAGRKSYVVYVAAISVATIVYSVMTPASWVYTAAPLAAAAATAWVVARRLPAAFDLAGGDESHPGPGGRAAGFDAADRTPLLAYGKGSRLTRRLKILGVIWREALNRWPIWIVTLLLFATVWSLTSAYYNVYNLLYEYVTLMLWCWVILAQSVRRLNRLDSLPIHRRVVFSSVLLFMAIPVGLGFLTGYLLNYRLIDSPPAQVSFRDHTVRVPFEAWEVTMDGRAPAVSSPWGETYTPRATRLVDKGSKIAVYNPYEPGKQSSPRFVAYQIDRALARVHGPEAVSPGGASELARDSSFVEGVRKGEYTVEASLRRGSDLRVRTNAVILMIWFVMFVVVNAVWWRRYRSESEVVRTRWFAILFFGAPYAVVFGLTVLSARGLINDWAIVAAQLVALRSVAEAIRLDTGLLWTVTAVVGAVCLILLARLYARAEAPTERSGKRFLSEY